jgi:hypothetical protein
MINPVAIDGRLFAESDKLRRLGAEQGASRLAASLLHLIYMPDVLADLRATAIVRNDEAR